MTEETNEKKLIGGVKMIPRMNVIPWDPKALKQETARIVRSFTEKEGHANPTNAENVMPIMHVTPWDMKALKKEVARVVKIF